MHLKDDYTRGTYNTHTTCCFKCSRAETAWETWLGSYIKMNLKEITVCDDVDWIQRRAVVSTVMDLQVAFKVGNSLTSYVTISFPGTMLHTVS